MLRDPRARAPAERRHPPARSGRLILSLQGQGSRRLLGAGLLLPTFTSPRSLSILRIGCFLLGWPSEPKEEALDPNDEEGDLPRLSPRGSSPFSDFSLSSSRDEARPIQLIFLDALRLTAASMAVERRNAGAGFVTPQSGL